MKKAFRYSTHHIVPRSQWGNNDEDNLSELRETQHRAIHTLYANRLIAEQLITTLDLSKQAMRPEVVEWLVDTLTAHDVNDLDFWYKPNTHF
jgi:hypothetical protein